MFKKVFLFILALVLLVSCAVAEDIHGYDKKQGGYTYVTFGSYPTEKNGDEAPILWRVLAVDGYEAFLLAEYILDVHYVHEDTKAYYTLNWEDSDLFAYLQTDFKNRAFSAMEQAVLLQCTEDGGLVSLPRIDDIRNKAYGFSDNKSRECSGTPYAKENGLFQYNDHNSPWVSRNKSQDRPQQQRRVMDEGKLGTVPCGNVDLGVRPCVYVNLSKLAINGGSGTKDDPYQLASTVTPLLPTQTPVEPTPAPTAAPVMESDTAGDELSNLIEQLANEQETEPTAEPAPAILPEPTAEPAAEPTAIPSPAVAAQEPQATPFSIGGIVYQTESGEVVTSLAAVTPAPVPTQEPAATEAPVVENVPEDVPAIAVPTEEPVADPPAVNEDGVFTAGADPQYIHPSFPELTAEGFLPEGQVEFVLEDEENGLWLYADQQLRIQIERKTGTNSKDKPLRWFEARIFTRDNTELFDLYPWDAENYKNHYKITLADEIALKHQLVFAINSDYFIFREARQHDKDVNYTYPKGLIIRDGEVFYDVPRKSSDVYPPLDVMAFYPDGTMKVFLNNTITAKEMLKTGATDTLSFGPILVENGQLSPRSAEYGNTPNPRTAFGYVEPGHYVCVVVESRIKESNGESCVWMGKKMHELGCESAINLDGGATSTMLFMGKQINKCGNYGDITNRKQNELIGIGHSENVGK